MKVFISICLVLVFGTITAAHAEAFNPEEFAKDYFKAWTATQSPGATKEDLEHYLSFLSEDVGHQHLPYDSDDTRSSNGKKNIREGMSYYLGGHTEYSGKLISHTNGYGVVVIKYETSSKGIHPQTKQVIVQNYLTVEVLEIESGKVSVIRKYSE
jgi:hypothetical protein